MVKVCIDLDGGDIEIASQAEAEAGVDNEKMMTPQRVKEAILAQVNPGLQNNLSASVPPTATDDSNAGYSEGSFWIDTTNDQAYRCVDDTVTAAKWIKTTLQTSDLDDVAISGNSDDLTEGTTNLLLTDAERTKLAGIAAGAQVNPSVISQAEAEAGTATTERIVTAERLKQAIEALSPASGYTGTTNGAIPFVNSDKSLTENSDYASIELANGRTTLQALAGKYITETDAATVNFDLATSNSFTVTLGGNRTLTVSNAKVGQIFYVRLEQDLNGSRLATWWPTIYWPDATEPVLTTTGRRADWFHFICIAENRFDCFCRVFNLPVYVEPQY